MNAFGTLEDMLKGRNIWRNLPKHKLSPARAGSTMSSRDQNRPSGCITRTGINYHRHRNQTRDTVIRVLGLRSSATLRQFVLINKASSFERKTEDPMPNTVFERTEEHITEAAHKASRAANAIAEAAENAIGTAKRTGKQVGDAAEELMDDTTQRIKRHPVETVVATYTLGLVTGILIGWIIGRR
jgi:ElaB/YqjD/DUF883 family membrane-anchored ribosome-binding protein